MKKKFLYNAFLIVLCFVLTSCGSKMKMLHSWTDDSLKGYSVDDVLVIGFTRDHTSQRLFEDSFVEGFVAENITAVQSYKTSGWETKPDKEKVREAIEKSGAKTVLMTILIDKKTKINRYAGMGSLEYVSTAYYSGMYSFYGSCVMAVPITTTTGKTLYLESNLYDVASEKLIWTGLTEAKNPTRIKTDFQKFAKVLMDDLRQQNILSP
ncbi:MAG: hypothetical protein U9R66_12400 [Thermodesulfobacteriota bacterium]|nr:hypothetical protein [Thermodesulfobacteriota bacterium]